MSHRPRLVEEGKPISQESNEDHQRYLESLESEYQKTVGHSSSSMDDMNMMRQDEPRHHQQQHQQHQERPSSLQSRLKHSAPTRTCHSKPAPTSQQPRSTCRSGSSSGSSRYKVTRHFEIGAAPGAADDRNHNRSHNRRDPHPVETPNASGKGRTANRTARPKLVTKFEIKNHAAAGADADSHTNTNANVNTNTNTNANNTADNSDTYASRESQPMRSMDPDLMEVEEYQQHEHEHEHDHDHNHDQQHQQMHLQHQHHQPQLGVSQNQYTTSLQQYHQQQQQPPLQYHNTRTAPTTINQQQQHPYANPTTTEEDPTYLLDPHPDADPHPDPDPSERMEIDDVHLQRLPMVVLDGANVAHAYVHATQGHSNSVDHDHHHHHHHHHQHHQHHPRNDMEPNVLGIQIAVSYFRNAGCRVQVVVPAYWMRRKPRRHGNENASASGTAASNQIQRQRQIQVLQKMQEENILCCSPPTDDDDAYCIAIAMRIDARSRVRRGEGSGARSGAASSSSLQSSRPNSNSNDLTDIGGAFILSNDLFRDAMGRDGSGDLRGWLKGEGTGTGTGAGGAGGNNFPRRISYSFCDLGSMNKYGDEQLDFVPNPRHPLVAMVERSNREHGDYVND